MDFQPVVPARAMVRHTGMTAGVGLSGDLRDPGRSIPRGTLAATIGGMVVYLFMAWKLAACIRDGAPPEILGTYESERRPHAVQYVELSMRLGGLINTSKTKQALEAAFPQADGSAKLESIAPPLGKGLWASSAARQLSHQVRLKSGQRMDDVAGNGALLLCQSDINVPQGYTGRHLAGDEEPAIESYLQQNNCVAMLIRPDRYIYGKAAEGPELESLVQSWHTAVTNKHIL